MICFEDGMFLLFFFPPFFRFGDFGSRYLLSGRIEAMQRGSKERKERVVFKSLGIKLIQ